MNLAVQQLLPAGEIDVAGTEVLVVDDDTSFRLLIAMTLKQLGCIVHAAANGHEALLTLERTKAQVMISDWMMPGLDGLGLCRAVRSRALDRYVHITLLTSRDERADYIEAMEAGADDFAIKPADRDTLLVRLVAARRVIELEQQLRAEHDHVARLYKDMATDLEAAASLQKQLLPQDRDDKLVQIMSTVLPASHVSGDCQNHFDLSDGRILIYQADTAGHGIRAALLAFSVQRLITPGFCKSYNDVLEPKAIIERLNDRLQSHSDVPEYFTIFLAMVDPQTGHVQFCQAGHPNAAIMRHDGGIDWVGKGGFPVGMLPFAHYENDSAVLGPGDRLLIMSDGIPECPDERGYQLGEARLTSILERLQKRKEAGDVGTELIGELQRTWSGSDVFEDDVSVLTIKRK